jgi:hypothetical protein
LLLSFPTSADLSQLRFEIFGDLDVGSMHGDHNTACQAPTTLREVTLPPAGTDPGQAVWHCAPAGPDTGHFMTGMNSGGYREVNFAPINPDGSDRVFVDVNRVCWKQNETVMGAGGAWSQVAIIPIGAFVANGRDLDYGDPDLRPNNGPAAATHALPATAFLAVHAGGGNKLYVGADEISGPAWSLSRYYSTDKAARYSNCLEDLGNGHIRATMQRPTGNDVETWNGSFPNGPVAVVWNHAVYDPPKRTGYDPDTLSIHWDDLLVDVA